MRRPSTFKKSDMIRFIKAVQAAGLEVARLGVNRDCLIVEVLGKPNAGSTEVNEWDEVLHGDASAQIR
jgi:hypothetical protein